MDSKKRALSVSGSIFLLVAVAHAVRSIFHAKVVIGNFDVPTYYSVIAAVIAFALSLWMFKSMR